MTGLNPDFFRSEAVQHHLQAEEGRGLVRVSPSWTWALLTALLSGLVAAVAVACMGRVEVKGRARGILRPTSGIRVLVAKLDGTVGQIEAHSGQQVVGGQVLVRIETPPVKAGLLEAERQLAAVHTHYQTTTRMQDKAHAEQFRRLESRAARLREQIGSQRHSVGLSELNLTRTLRLGQEGILSPAQVDEARQTLAQTQSHLSQSEQALEQVSQELAALENTHHESLWQRRMTIHHAEVRVESQSLLLAQTLHEALEDCVVEAMLVKPGETVRAGQALCKLIPHKAPLHVVAFLMEKDRAFVRQGDEVVLELDQLPYAEYGTARARVERVSDDLASVYEIQEALGDNPIPQVPAYRIELLLMDSKASAKAGIPLRSGMLLNARFTLRRQRLITLVLDPLRKWLH